MAVPRLRLPRSSRIKQPGDFARARAQGERLAVGCLIVNALVRPPGAASRVGVITSRKIGNAVARSRVRRLLREAFRLHQHDLPPPIDLALVARPSIAGKNFAQVEKDLLQALGRLKLAKGPA